LLDSLLQERYKMEESKFLEPTLTEEQSRGRAIHSFLNPKPDMSGVSKSKVLDQVKGFLPKMAEAEQQLNCAIKQGLSNRYNVEDVEDDEKVIEMDVAILKDSDEYWTSDSEADSTPSQSENDYTSDSDISSSSACSSSSCSSDGIMSPDRNRVPSGKRSLIQDVTETPTKLKRTNS